MFTGVSTYRATKRANSYTDALAVWENCRRTPTIKRLREEREHGYPLGHRSASVTWVRERGGDIIFRLYGTDVVMWHPDGAVTIKGWPSVTTAQFAEHFLPGGLGLNSDSTVTFQRDRRVPDQPQRWRDYYRNHETCRVEHPVTFRRTEHGWSPDVDDLKHQPFRFSVLDRKAARRIAREYPFADFRLWLEMVNNHRVAIEHRKEDYDLCLDLLQQRDFRSAAIHLPLIWTDGNFGRFRKPTDAYGITTSDPNCYVSMTSLRRLRDHAYDQHGAYATTEFLTVPYLGLLTWRKRQKALEKAGVEL